MPRHSSYGQKDKQPEINGDTGFLGVNMRLDPSVLPPGLVSAAINCRFNKGIIETRLGSIFPAWANASSNPSTSSGVFSFETLQIIISGTTATCSTRIANPGHTGAVTDHGLQIGQKFNLGWVDTPVHAISGNNLTITAKTSNTISWTTSFLTPGTYNGLGFIGPYTTPGSSGYGWGTIYGVGVYADPNTFREYLIIATNNGVFYTSESNTPYLIPLPSGITITDTVNFTQAFDVLIMHRGPNLSTLKLSSIHGSWEEIGATTSADTGLSPIPNATRSLFVQNRVFVPYGNDLVAVSDFNDYTSYLPILQQFRINQGSADSLVTIEKFNDTTLIAFKDHSVFAINNVYGDLSAAQLDGINDRFGCAAAKSVAKVGSDLWFLSELGVMSIRQTEQNKLQGVALPVSDAIQPLIDRINWRFASNAVSAYWDNKYYLAVPLDEAEILGYEMIPQGLSKETTATLTYGGLVVGKTYRWVNQDNSTTLTNGAQVFSTSASAATNNLTNGVDFVATATTVTIAKTGFAPYLEGDSLKLVNKGVNNAVLVYDLLNQAWSGYDTVSESGITNFLIYTVVNKRRLFIQTSDGFIKLYEEDYEDQLSATYTDVIVTGTPVNGHTISVNGGTTVTSNTAASVNSGSSWGTIDDDTANTNLWSDSASAAGGYGPDATSPWTAPNTVPTRIVGLGAFGGGVRFRSTIGIIPQVVTTGSSWISVLEVGTAPVESSFLTRAYAPQAIDTQDYHWITTDLETWNPEYSIDVVMTGENEEFNQVTDRTKDRTAWYAPFNKAAFDLLNATGHYMDKYREDYSLLLGSGLADGEAASVRLDTSDGIRLDLHQSVRETFKVKVRDTGLQLSLSNTQGRFRCTGIIVEGTKEPITGRTLA